MVVVAALGVPCNVWGLFSALVDVKARRLAAVNGELQIVGKGRVILETLCLMTQIGFVFATIGTYVVPPPPPALTAAQVQLRLTVAASMIMLGLISVSLRVTRAKLYRYYHEERLKAMQPHASNHDA